MAQHRYDRLSKRLSGIEGRRHSREPIILVHNLGEDPMLRAAAIDPTGQRPVMVINTGVPRHDPDPDFCSRESVAAALSEAKAKIVGQRELADRDTQNDFGGFAERMEEHWLGLCRRFDLDYGVPAHGAAV